MVKTRLRCAGASDPGRVRRNNEDAFYIDGDRGILLVVDGIGGQAAGEKAAEIAVERIRARLERQTGTPEERVREAIAMANNEILNAAQSHPGWEGMACVLTLALLDNGAAVVGHVGDSRLYQIRRGEIRKITSDHSPVGEREDNRELSETQAMQHPRRNEVFRDVGSESHAPDDADFIELRRVPFEADSALLLCSDGLTDQVPSATIRSAVERHAGHPDAAVRELIDAANRAGGKDNVTVVIAEGEDFVASRPEHSARRPARLLVPLGCFLAGLALASAGAWLSRRWWVPAPVPVAPRVLAAGPGTEFPAIAAAMAQARAGDTVEVLLGDYREQVLLKDGVTLRSRIPLEATLRAVPLSDTPAVIARNVKAARISGFRIVGDTAAPLSAGMLLENSSVDVDDADIAGAAVGIEIRGGNVAVRSSDIHDCGAQGLLIWDASPWIAHNTFRRNRAAAIAARGASRPVLFGNLFDGAMLELPPEMPAAVVRERNIFVDASKAGKKR